MQPFKTVYRVVVMAAALAIVVMLWRLYGPTAEQVKSTALRALEWAQRALQPAAEPATLSPAPALPAPQESGARLVTGSPPLFGATPIAAPPLHTRPPGDSTARSGNLADLTTRPIDTSDTKDALSDLLARLTQLGVQDAKLAPWGADGKLVRFTCRAPWGDSPQFGRHLEAIADDPIQAVEQVMAQIDPARLAQRESRTLR